MTRSRRVTRRLAVVTLVAALMMSAVTVTAQEAIDGFLTPEHAAELAIKTDNQVALLQRKLQDQLADLGISGFLEDISVRLSGSLGGNADTAPSAAGSAALSAGIEIIPQLTLTGNIAASGSIAGTQADGPDPLSGSVGLSFNPLADPTGRDRDKLAAESTAVDLAYATGSAAYGAIGSLLDALNAQMELDLLVKQQDLAVRSLANTRALYDRDRANDQQLTSAEDAVRTGAERIVRAELSLDRAYEVVARDVGIPSEAIRIPAADELDLDPYVAGAAELAGSLSAAELAELDVAVFRAAQDVRSAQLDLESIHRFSPRVSISASGGLPNRQYSVGAELTVSPADWNGTAAEDARSDLAFAEREYDYALRLAEYDALAALNELQFSLDDLEVALGDLADARQDLAEAAFRFGRGDITQLSLDQTQLGVAEAEHEVTGAMLNVVRRLMAIDYGQY